MNIQRQDSRQLYTFIIVGHLSKKEYGLIAKQAYKAYKKERYIPEGKVLEIKSGDRSFGLINIDRNKMIIGISLRGTANPSDWLDNIDMKVDEANYVMICGVHSEYLRLADLIFPKIKEQLETEFPDLSLISNYEINFTGHSIGNFYNTYNILNIKIHFWYTGGAVAQILAIHLYYDTEFGLEKQSGVNNKANQIKILSFSSPEVFSFEFNNGIYPLGDDNLIRFSRKKKSFHLFDLYLLLFIDEGNVVPRLSVVGEYTQFGTAKSIESLGQTGEFFENVFFLWDFNKLGI